MVGLLCDGPDLPLCARASLGSLESASWSEIPRELGLLRFESVEAMQIM